jgi:hypothetical protein
MFGGKSVMSGARNLIYAYYILIVLIFVLYPLISGGVMIGGVGDYGALSRGRRANIALTLLATLFAIPIMFHGYLISGGVFKGLSEGKASISG